MAKARKSGGVAVLGFGEKPSSKQINDFIEEIETEQAMSKTYHKDVDISDEVPLIEDEEEAINNFLDQEEEEFTEEEVEMFLENVNYSKNDNESGLSFDDMMPKKQVETGIKLQRKENVVTPHYLVLRELVEKTPSVCTYRDCFYDGAKAIKYKNWHKVPEKRRRIALIALERHTQQEHRFKDSDIIDKSEVASSWLSSTIL